MPVHISDSAIYRNSWGTSELRALFDDAALTAGWIEVMVVLAETEAEFGLVPAAAASELAVACRAVPLDEVFFAEVREDFERTNHSMLGLIRALQRRCPGDSGEWLCYGATVQDITDTHTARILVKVRDIFEDQLTRVATVLCDLARRYRDTPMCGRTHGQPGLSITFGFKAAGWLDEIQRHCQRLDEVGGAHRRRDSLRAASAVSPPSVPRRSRCSGASSRSSGSRPLRSPGPPRAIVSPSGSTSSP